MVAENTIILRKWESKDIPSLVKYANNKKIWDNVRNRFPHPYTESDARDWINIATSRTKMTNLAIDRIGEAIGGIEIVLQNDIYSKNAEIGYWIAEPFWGNGYATYAVRQMTDHAFKNFDLNRLYAGVMSNNAASIKVLEKAGYLYEATLREAIFKCEKYLDEIIYAMIRDTWQYNSSSS